MGVGQLLPFDIDMDRKLIPGTDHREGDMVDRSASIALTKLMCTKRSAVVDSTGPMLNVNSNCPSRRSVTPPKSKNVMFNHKHLQYIPLAAHQDHRRRGLVPPPHQPHQPMTSLLVNGRSVHTQGHYHHRPDLQLSPAQQHQQYSERDRHPRYAQQPQQHQSSQQQQQQHQSSQQQHSLQLRPTHPPPPVTKSVGVGANLNYPRGGPILGRPLSQEQGQGRQGQGSEGELRDLRVMTYHQQGMSRYEVPPPRQSPSDGSSSHGSVLSISMGHNLGHSSDVMPHHTRVKEMVTTPQKVDSGSSQGQRSPLPQHLHQQPRPPSPGGSTVVKPKFTSLPAPSSLTSAQVEVFNSIKTGSKKIVSQNLNGTLSVTGMPSNDSELQLFHVLQRANLLNYFDVMIELGGDDVQQLCEAGEEEFLEIMALIGMASKPLHVRRLQKSLQEFLTHPNLLPNPILGPPLSAFTHNATASDTTSTSTTSTTSKTQLPIRPIPFHSTGTSNHFSPSTELGRHYNPKFYALRTEPTQSTVPVPSPTVSASGSERSNSPAKPDRTTPVPGNLNSIAQTSLPSPSSSTSSNSNSNSGFSGTPFTLPNGISVRFPADQILSNQLLESRLREGKVGEDRVQSSAEQNSENPDSRSSLSPVPFLQDGEIEKIRESAIRLIQTLPGEFLEPKVNGKRKSSTDFETVIRIPDEDPKRVEEIRKFATIYARYNCKRKAQKPLTIHELSTNEAASQLCLRLPALLTRREDLKLLSREVVRNAGLPYSSIISATTFRDFGLNGRRTPLDTSGGSTDHSPRPHSAPSIQSNLPEDMSHSAKLQNPRPESSPASTENKAPLSLSSDVTVNHAPRKRVTSAVMAMTSPKERKLDDDLRTFQTNMKYEVGN